jgi:hypothetical protein
MLGYFGIEFEYFDCKAIHRRIGLALKITIWVGKQQSWPGRRSFSRSERPS